MRKITFKQVVDSAVNDIARGAARAAKLLAKAKTIDDLEEAYDGLGYPSNRTYDLMNRFEGEEPND